MMEEIIRYSSYCSFFSANSYTNFSPFTTIYPWKQKFAQKMVLFLNIW